MNGIFNILVTPFNEEGDVDESSLRNLVEFQVGAGVSGLTILAILGEGQKLSDTEWGFVLDTVVEQVRDRVPVVVTVTHPSTRIVVERVAKAVQSGAAAVMAAPPTMLRNLDSVVEFYKAVGNASSIPVVVQDEPATTGVILPASFLATTGHAMIKLEEPPVPQKLTRILQLNPDAQIYGGLGGLYFLEELERGAVGTMTGFALTEVLVSIYNDFNSDNRARARETFYRHLPLIRYEAQLGVGLAIRKEVLKRRGIISCANIRSPGIKMDEQGRSELTQLLEYLHVNVS